MRHGGEENLKWLREMSKIRGKPMKALMDMPSLMPHLEPVLRAFDMLSASRSFGFSVGPIPLGEIITYLQWDGPSSIDKQLQWAKYIRIMDAAYLEQVNKRT